MEELNIDLASEFLVMAATLIHIKSKMLLPPPHEDGTTDELGEDPRNELVARLLEYQRYKEAAQQLHQQEEVRAAIWIRPEEAMRALEGTNGHAETPAEGLVEVDLFELFSAFREVLERVRQRVDLVYEREVISIEEMIERVKKRLSRAQSFFVDLFEAYDRATVIVTFLAVLELTRLREIGSISRASSDPSTSSASGRSPLERRRTFLPRSRDGAETPKSPESLEEKSRRRPLLPRSRRTSRRFSTPRASRYRSRPEEGAPEAGDHIRPCSSS
jgi:segregation and condensation protein A